MFPGVVSSPFSVVKLGPDCGPDAYSGYSPMSNIEAFSLMHESGTGGAPKYGVVSQQPYVGNVSNPLGDLSSSRSAPDQAQVGLYQSSLSNGITVQLAATSHAAMLSYAFPAAAEANVVVDVSHVLTSVGQAELSQHYINGNIKISPIGIYEGSGTYNNGWNLAPDWTVYFCGQFDKTPTNIQVFSGNDMTLNNYGPNAGTSGTERVGAVYSFADPKITARIGISFISSGKACQLVNDEIPAGTALQDLVDNAKSNWNTEVFSKIHTPETNRTNLQLLYSSLYGMHLIPSNRTGENPLWQSNEPYYDDFFTFWDLFRCSTPLMQIIQPAAYEEQIRSIIDIWRNEGYLPDARSSNYNGRSQGGSNADNVLADGYVKGVRGAVNWADGYAAMKKDAKVQPTNNNDPQAPDSSTREGRGALPDWLAYNYITPNYTRAVSRAIEYATNDFALPQVARGLGATADAEKHLTSSQNWRNHWNPSASSLNNNGFVVPRAANGSFLEQDPLSCGGCYWGDAYYEGTPWEYSFAPHHDMAYLINLTGGPETFVDKLDTIFQPDLNPAGEVRFGNTIFNPGNEPSFASPYLFNFAGRQDRSVLRSRQIAKLYYDTSPSGLPGNSDAGAMQTWLLWNMIGLYPLTGQTTFLIHAPWFSMAIDLGDGKKLAITTSREESEDSIYVQSLKVNGQVWNKAWLSWDDVFAIGGTMDFVLGPDPSGWTQDGELPPSPAS